MASAVDKLRARVAFVQNQRRNLRPAVNKIHTEFIEDRKVDFATGGATTQHGAWKANRPRTIRAKGHGRVLFGIPSGGYQLHKSIVNRRHNDHVFNWNSKTLEIGTRHWKARIHHLGISRNAPGVKRRPIDPTTGQRRRYTRILLDWVMKGTL